MTVTRLPSVSLRALLPSAFLVLAVTLPVAAHAELVSSDPADEAVVEGPFSGPVVLAFDEALAAGSKAEMKGPDGATVGAADVAGDELIFTFDDALELGTYTIQWTSVAADRDVERGTLTFTVVPPPPTPTPAPTATPGATPTPPPTPSPVVTPSPTPSGGGTSSGSVADVALPLLGVLIAIVVLGAFLLRSRRPAGR